MQRPNLVSRRIVTSPLLLLCAVLLAACGSDGDETANQVPQVKKPDAAPVPVDPTAKMARAVTVGKSNVPVELKYEIASKPTVGVPIEMELAFVPKQGADSMTMGFTASAGLTLSADSAPSLDVVKVGQPHTVKLSVLTDKPEVFFITVTATLYNAGTSAVRTFAIPLIVSEPAAAAPAEPQKAAVSEGKKT